MGKLWRKCASKAGHRVLLILVNNPKQQLHARNSFENMILREYYQKALKKLILFFSF